MQDLDYQYAVNLVVGSSTLPAARNRSRWTPNHEHMKLAQALCGGLITALQILLLRQPPASDCAAHEAVRRALTRCGAGGLLTEVAALAGDLGAIAAVSEAVHRDIYVQLSEDLF